MLIREKKLVSWGWGGKGYTPNLFIKYKLTREGFDKYWNAQDGKCAGCEEEFAHPLRNELRQGIKPEVDHCHRTGKVRGLLCGQCNALLGKIEDNAEQLERLSRYLKSEGVVL